MTGMGDVSPDGKSSSCGLLNAVFGRRSFWPRRTTSTGSVPSANGADCVKTPSTPTRRRSGSDEPAFLENNTGISDVPQKPVTKAPNHPKIPPVQQQCRNYGRELPGQATNNNVSSNHPCYQNQGHGSHGRRVPKEANGISGELESMIADYQKSKGSSNLVRASSSNVMLFGNLGNLRQPGSGGGGGGNTNSYGVLDHLPKTREESATPTPNGKYPNCVMGNIVKSKQNEEKSSIEQPGSLCRVISTRMDPEQLKIMGNEDYKNGNFAEALALYDAAISIDPNKASYRSNKSAALTALGDAEKATYHYKHAGPEADQDDISKAKGLQVLLNKCTEARRLRDWKTLIKVAEAAISNGADSAPQIYALQSEALIKVHKHQEAEEVWKKSPNFDVDACTRYFGPIGNAHLLAVRAQVDMATGRFDGALVAAEQATRLDSNNKEASSIMRRTKAVAATRSNGNQLFKAAKFYEASIAYGEGLEHDPYNSVLLCNRAACRSKLGQYEKAMEDCNAALNVRPGYAKARLRRADCYAKLGKWEASADDYEILQKESPEDEEVVRALQEARSHLRKQKREDV